MRSNIILCKHHWDVRTGNGLFKYRWSFNRGGLNNT